MVVEWIIAGVLILGNVVGWTIAITGIKVENNTIQSTVVYVVNVNQNQNGNINLANVKYNISNAYFQSKVVNGTNIYISTVQERITNYVEMCQLVSNVIATNYSKLLLSK